MRWILIRNWPLFELRLTIPFVSIMTHICYERQESEHYDYIMMYIKLHKWNFSFRLYKSALYRLEKSK